jgi:hypothetical protein
MELMQMCDFLQRNKGQMFAWERLFGALALAWKFAIF